MKFTSIVRVACPDCPDANLHFKGLALRDDGNVVLLCGCTSCGEQVVSNVDRLFAHLFKNGGSNAKGN